MLYGREGWDPKRIVTQILMMQLLHYGSGVVVLGVLWAVAGVSFHERVLFAWDEMRLDSVDGWGAVVCALLSAAASGFWLSVVVERMKKVVDFGLTLYFWHGVTVLAYSGSFPWSWTWGVVQVLSAATTVALGMYLCFQSELQPISVQDVLRRDEERKRSRSMDRGAGASASGGAGASAATATTSSSATSVAANGSGGAGLAASSSTATLRSTSAASGAASSGNRTPTPGSPGRSPKLLGSPVVHHAVLDAALDALSSSSSAPGGSPVVQTNVLAPHNVFGEAAPLPLSTPTKLLGGVAAAHGRIRSTGASPVQAPIAAAPPSTAPAGGAASSTDPSALGLPPRARSGRRIEP